MGFMKNIILINGLPRAGKDTVADMIIQLKGYKKVSFATPMKKIISETFGISLQDLELFKNSPSTFDVRFSNKSTNFREILQRFGSEGMKPLFGDSVWADLTYKKIKESNENNFVVPDFRFMVEYQQPKNTNVISLLVKDKRELPLEGHASDVELYQNNFKFDYCIENTGTLQELEQKVLEFIKEINA